MIVKKESISSFLLAKIKNNRERLPKSFQILAKMYEINFYHQYLARICSTKWEQFV